jgi:DNA-binding transcriptional LysR family regulator
MHTAEETAAQHATLTEQHGDRFLVGYPYGGAWHKPDMKVVSLYEEQYVLLVSGEQLVPGARTITWAQAAELPLALLTPDMRFRQFIDKAFASSGALASPQVETDSVASLYAHVATGTWASVVPHTWLRAMPVTSAARAIRLVEPDTTAQISMAIHASSPGSGNPARVTLHVPTTALSDCEW